jgi:hypothetical protein
MLRQCYVGCQRGAWEGGCQWHWVNLTSTSSQARPWTLDNSAMLMILPVVTAEVIS